MMAAVLSVLQELFPLSDQPCTSSPLAQDSAQPEDNYDHSSTDESGMDDHDAHAVSNAEQDDDLTIATRHTFI